MLWCNTPNNWRHNILKKIVLVLWPYIFTRFKYSRKKVCQFEEVWTNMNDFRQVWTSFNKSWLQIVIMYTDPWEYECSFRNVLPHWVSCWLELWVSESSKTHDLGRRNETSSEKGMLKIQAFCNIIRYFSATFISYTLLRNSL